MAREIRLISWVLVQLRTSWMSSEWSRVSPGSHR
ncbi:unnamed protein product [Brassica rapa subsp. trilocularis]